MKNTLESITIAAEYIKKFLGGKIPTVGVVLGSGLGKLADRIESAVVIPYKDIPGFPVSTATGHKGNLIFGELGGKFVVAMQGRIHYYEGYPMDRMALPIRVLKVLGVEYLFVSNATGACNPDFKVGDLVIIKDHINLLPNPLVGPNLDEFGPRFPDMTCAYDPGLRALAARVGGDLGISLKEGVLLANSGPTYETPAEVRYFRAIGADMLGMSTTQEVIIARHCGISVFGMSVITNVSNTSNTEDNFNDGDDVIVQGDKAADRMSSLFERMIASL